MNQLSINLLNIDLNDVPLINRITTRNDDADSVQWRLDVLTQMAPQTLNRPLFGYGLGNFITLRQQGDIGLLDDPEAHNDYLRLAIEIGFVGLICYLMFIFTLLRQGVETYIINPKHSLQQQYALALISLIAAFYVMSVSDNILQGTPVMWSLMLIVGALVGLRHVSQQDTQTVNTTAAAVID
jgi:O-antigen ligase